MKGLSNYLLAVTLSLVCGCNLLDSEIISAQRGDKSGEGDYQRDTSANYKEGPVFDTTIFCTAIRCPENYDWRLDTACGNANCQILLYLNGEIERSIEAGRGTNISADPDFIHTVKGEIYTECPSFNENIICVDGRELMRIPSRERLRGILNTEGHIYTVTQNCIGTGIVFREDNKELFRNDLAVVFGGFDDSSYGESGALYEDESHFYFCYKEQGAFTSCHSVTDGVDETVDLPGSDTVLDMKIIQGEPVFATAKGFGYVWSSAGVYGRAGGAVVAGACAKDTKDAPVRCCVINVRSGETAVICPEEARIYCGSTVSWAICTDRKGEITIYSNKGIDYLPDAYYFFNARCATPCGDNLLLALTPRDNSVRPTLKLGSKEYVLEGLGNGFVAGVSCNISQTR